MTTRRQFLGWGVRAAVGLIGLGAAGVVGYEWPWAPKTRGSAGTTTTSVLSPADPNANSSQVYSFYTRPDLQPPRVTTVSVGPAYNFGGAGSGHVLVAPKGFAGTGPGQDGLMILDGDGRLRWFMPTTKLPFDLQYQQYRGKPVLTWWEGAVDDGTGAGEGFIVDTSFRPIARLGEVDGLYPDLHELNLTSDGTALMTAYHKVKTDLSSVGGPGQGYVWACAALEVEVASGKLLHRWDSLDHVPLPESYQKFSGGTEDLPFDYFHINSIAPTADGDLLISARNTWTVYKVGRSTGEVKWRLNGKKSDFHMGQQSRFYWQHHARPHSDSRLTLFDDGSTPPEEEQSRGLVLHVDEATMTCSLDRAFVHPARLLAPNQGSLQLLADGGVFVGWGAEPYFSRFSPGGDLLVDGSFPVNVQSYRSFVADVTTTPTDKPAVVIGSNPLGGSSVYVSWNGATEVVAWRVLAGKRQSPLAAVAYAEWTDFETAVSVDSRGPYFQVVALDRSGQEIGRSVVVTA
jgi:Arylsulfotransferase (ASST)